jgi:hypothetical protein
MMRFLRSRIRVLPAWITTGVIAALMALPATAEDTNPEDDGPIFTGLIDVNMGFRKLDSSDLPTTHGEHFTYGAGGKVNVPLLSGFSTQLDLQSEMYEDGSNGEAPEGAHMVTGHVNWRNNRVLVGAFGGGGQGVSTTDGASTNATTGFVAGGEVQVYLGDFTLYAQEGYGDFRVDSGEGFLKGWFSSFEGRYYFHEDYGVRAGFSYGETPDFIDDDDEGEIWNWDAEVFGRVVQRYPIYATFGYQGGNYDATSEGDQARDHRVVFGARFLFGAKTAKENDRRGATLSSPMLPARTAAWTEPLD